MRDVSDAYRWAQTLPSTVREEFKSGEAKVAAFITTKRLNNPIVSAVPETRLTPTTLAPEHSRSAQDFQKALKDLQPELNQFDFAPTPPTPTATQTSSQTAQSVTITKVTTQQATQRSIPEELDSRSRAALQEIREGLNLSSDIEAIRVCIAMGHKHLKSLLGL